MEHPLPLPLGQVAARNQVAVQVARLLEPLPGATQGPQGILARHQLLPLPSCACSARWHAHADAHGAQHAALRPQRAGLP